MCGSRLGGGKQVKPLATFDKYVPSASPVKQLASRLRNIYCTQKSITFSEHRHVDEGCRRWPQKLREVIELNCPYCLARIPSEAEVCRYCARDVGRLLKAEERIAELQAQVTSNEETTVADKPDGAWLLRGPIWSFYAISIICGLTFDISHLDYITPSLGFATGVVTIILRRDINIWTLFLVGFVQPFLTFVVLSAAGKVSISLLQSLVASFFLMSSAVGGAVALGALTAAVFSGHGLSRKQIGASSLLEWMSTAETRLDRIEGFIVKLGAVITAATLLISKFFLE